MGTQYQAELLFGRYRRQILALLLLRPEESFYVRELERISGMRAGPLHRELTALAEAGLVRRLSRGNQVHYQANCDCPIYAELAGIFRKAVDEGATSSPTALETREPEPPLYNAPDALARGKRSAVFQRLSVPKRSVAAICRKYRIRNFSFFGSVTRADFRPDSDVDVLVEFRRGESPGLFGLVRLRDELSQVFGRSVDVVTTGVFRNPIRRRNIEEDLECVYAAA